MGARSGPSLPVLISHGSAADVISFFQHVVVLFFSTCRDEPVLFMPFLGKPWLACAPERREGAVDPANLALRCIRFLIPPRLLRSSQALARPPALQPSSACIPLRRTIGWTFLPAVGRPALIGDAGQGTVTTRPITLPGSPAYRSWLGIASLKGEDG
jgi:hypothetical protein